MKVKTIEKVAEKLNVQPYYYECKSGFMDLKTVNFEEIRERGKYNFFFQFLIYYVLTVLFCKKKMLSRIFSETENAALFFLFNCKSCFFFGEEMVYAIGIVKRISVQYHHENVQSDKSVLHGSFYFHLCLVEIIGAEHLECGFLFVFFFSLALSLSSLFSFCLANGNICKKIIKRKKAAVYLLSGIPD